MKRINKKRKVAKTAPRPASTPADQDVVVLLTTLVRKLTTFESKMDTVLSRIPAQPSAVPQKPPAPAAPPERHKEYRQMYKAVCADCGNGCEVPFKPKEGRPIYCKGCFSVRKNNGTFDPRADARPKEVPAAPVRPAEAPKAAGPAKAAGKKPKAKKKNKRKR